MGLAFGRAHNYIRGITNVKMLPTVERRLEICGYFNVAASEFFGRGLK
ncbi:hypothetical protein NE664_07325 [Anaerotignum faecicola]|nr:hypothetical protein [Anaerotignum faecicola]